MTKLIKATIVAIVMLTAIPIGAQAACVRATDKASDGSICGGRAAYERSGGREQGGDAFKLIIGSVVGLMLVGGLIAGSKD